MDKNTQDVINTGRKLIKDLKELQKRIEKKRKTAFFETNRVEDDTCG